MLTIKLRFKRGSKCFVALALPLRANDVSLNRVSGLILAILVTTRGVVLFALECVFVYVRSLVSTAHHFIPQRFSYGFPVLGTVIRAHQTA